MNEAANIVLAVLALMIPILGMLVAALYSNILKKHGEIDKRHDAYEADNDANLNKVLRESKEIHDQIWAEINKGREQDYMVSMEHKIY